MDIRSWLRGLVPWSPPRLSASTLNVLGWASDILTGLWIIGFTLLVVAFIRSAPPNVNRRFDPRPKMWIGYSMLGYCVVSCTLFWLVP